MSRLYIAGPMSNLPDRNFPAFNAAARKLRSRNHEVLNPAELECDGMTWEQCLRRDIALFLPECDGLAVLDGWELSRGASLEVYVAQAVGIPVKGVKEWL